MSKQIEDFERTDYAVLAKEFDCVFRIGKRGVKFLSKDPSGKVYKLIDVIPLDGWYTDPKAVEHIMRERGMDL